jgi:hypothetical protein
MKDAQKQFDEEVTEAHPMPWAEVSVLLAKHGKTLPQEELYDPILNAIKRHPKLSKEKAQRMAKDFGF